MGDQPLRILIVDDHPVFRFGLRALLECRPLPRLQLLGHGKKKELAFTAGFERGVEEIPLHEAPPHPFRLRYVHPDAPLLPHDPDHQPSLLESAKMYAWMIISTG